MKNLLRRAFIALSLLCLVTQPVSAKDKMARGLASVAMARATRFNPFDAIARKQAALLPVNMLAFTDSTGRDSIPNDGTPARYLTQWLTGLVSAGKIPAAYTVQQIVWDSSLQKYVWGSTPVRQWGTGYTPAATLVGSISGTTLTVTSGTPTSGQALVAPGLPYGDYITSGSGATWTISQAPSGAISAGTTIYGLTPSTPPPLTWTLWQATVTGSIPNYFLGNNFLTGLAAVPADMMFMAHGINVASFYAATAPWTTQPTSYSKISGVFIAAIEQFRQINPAVPILVTTEHPLQTGTPDATGDTSWRPAILALAPQLGFAVDNSVFDQFNADGKPNSDYNGDGIHESTVIGAAYYVAMLNRWWNSALATAVPTFRPSLFSVSAGQVNLLNNPAFETWTTTTAAPDGWTASGSPTFAKDTTNYADSRKGYSVSLIPAAGTTAAYIQQTFSAAQIAALRGQWLTCAAREWADTGGTDNDLGRIGIIASSASQGTLSFISHGASSTITQSAGFRWVVQSVLLPLDLTAITYRSYGNIGLTADGTRGIKLDQEACVAGQLPMAARP